MSAVIAVELLPERRCDRCTANQKAEWGCEEKAKLPLKMDGEYIWRCPRRPIFEEPAFFSELFMLYRGYQKGFLPEEGSLGSQANTFTECVRYIDAALDRCEQHRREEAAKKRPPGQR